MIWLIGNKGMLGHDVEHLLNQNNLDYSGTDAEVDISDKKMILDYSKNNSVSYIVNCAAYTRVDDAETDRDQAFKINAEAVNNLAEISDALDIPLLHISTDYVFNGEKDIPYTEDDETAPRSVYGKSKLEGEKIITGKLKKYYIIRTAWLYGKHGNNFIFTIMNLLKEKDEIRIINDQYGSPTYTKDLAEIIINFIRGKKSPYGIYHFTNSGKTTWYEFACEIYRNLKEFNKISREVEINSITTDEYPLPAPRPYSSILSTDKVSKLFDINIRSWQDALKDFMNSELN